MASADLRRKVYLVGNLNNIITGSKLPSVHQVLGYFLYQHLLLKKTKREASVATMNQILPFWHKARIPIREEHHCQAKVEKLFEEWRLLKKNENRRSGTQVTKEDSFKGQFKNLFDIAHAQALTMIKLHEDREFLLAQREKGRRGSMVGVDATLTQQEERKTKRLAKEAARVKREHKAQHSQTSEAVQETSSSSSSASEYESSEDEEKAPVRKRGRRTVLTPSLCATLDRTKMSDRKAMMVVTTTAQGLGHNVGQMALNRSTIRRHRQKHRAQMSKDLKEEFQADVPLVVHWDGKLILDLTGKEKLDRLPVVVSGLGISQLLTVAKLAAGTGQAQADAVIAALKEWGLTHKIQAMCFDTTSSNTGRMNGACVLIEQGLKTQLLFLACRHHILEIIIRAVFSACMGFSASPEVLLFKRFQSHWCHIDQGNFEDASTDEYMARSLCGVKDDIMAFISSQLSKVQPRNDYRELLELSLIILGGVPIRGLRFMAPGAMHHARWMSKVIYSLKVWLFRSQFKLTSKELKGITEVVIFCINVYLKAWVTAPLATAAPRNDLSLIKLLTKYKEINPKISKAAVTKMAGHMWYLSEELVGLAFFDASVPATTKRLMVQALKSESRQHAKKKKVPTATLR